MILKVISKAFLVAVVSVSFVSMASARSKHPAAVIEPVVGQFDSLVFALSYQKDFCASHADREECKPGAIPTGMGLHGLWPNRDDDPQHKYGYCDISEQEMGKDWCAPKIDVKGKLTQAELGVLTLAMPGAKSCLYNHEWYTHGTCSGLSVEDYFMAASVLTFQFWKLNHVNELISDSAHASVSREDVLAALEKDVGPEVRDAVTIECRYDRQSKTSYLSEIHFSLNREKYMSFPAVDSLYPLKPITKKNGTQVKNLGSCPAEGIQITQ